MNKVVRIADIDKEIRAKNFEKATEKFCKVLIAKGYDWVAEAMTESVSNGYICDSNAMEHPYGKMEVRSPKTNDWSYYWAIEQLDTNLFYAWFIERGE